MERQSHVCLKYRNWSDMDGVGWKKRQSEIPENEVTADEEAILPC